MCTQMPKPPLEALADAKVERNKLVLFGHQCVHSFDLEDLLNVSAEVLGEGSVGRSYKQVLEGKNVTVVVKRLKHVVVTENEFRTRMEVLGKMKNENVVPLIGYYYSQDEKWLVYGYIDGGSLYDRLHGNFSNLYSNYYGILITMVC
ncbi:putative transferase, protein kinase RLK-Pelle-LRR-III family [Helianthus annuus]|nr:putative transferase, protein kinase RLK-Pelle-LRR-III family [Helianthus annuus]